MTLKEELEIVEKAKGNIQEFAKIYSHYIDKLHRYCINRTANRTITEEIVSEVFLKAIIQIKKFDTSQNIRFSSWLYTTAHNQIIDYYRKNNRVYNYEDWDDFISEKNVEDDLRLTNYQKQITFVLSKQKPRYQKVITLRFYSELEIGEIAVIFNMKSKGVSVLLHRALRDFRKKFTKFFPESEIFEDLDRYE